MNQIRAASMSVFEEAADEVSLKRATGKALRIG